MREIKLHSSRCMLVHDDFEIILTLKRSNAQISSFVRVFARCVLPSYPFTVLTYTDLSARCLVQALCAVKEAAEKTSASSINYKCTLITETEDRHNKTSISHHTTEKVFFIPFC